ncbi:MAG: hypothetical protein ACK5IC_10125 [Moheibacter sp.]
MKKILFILLILTLFNCKNMGQKIWENTSGFLYFEKKATIKSIDAIKIYETNFETNFNINPNILKDKNFSRDYKRIIYISDDDYNIGYRSLLDKRGDKNVPLKFLAKINSSTGEVSVVK